jgi:hypothetical protein
MKLLYATGFVAAMAVPAMASSLATSDEIKAAIIGNTVEGGMSDGAAYAEYYSEDGAIKADGYTGTWSLDGNDMCFDYGEGPACWSVSIDGDKVAWMNGDTEEGTGTIKAGNPNEF